MHRTASATRQSRLVQKAKAESRSCWNRHQLRARRSHLQNAKGSGRQAGSRNPAATRPRSLVSGMSHRTHAVGENSESTGMSSSNCHPVIPHSPGPLGQAVRTDTHPPDIPPEVPLSPPRAPAHPSSPRPRRPRGGEQSVPEKVHSRCEHQPTQRLVGD